MTARKRAPAAAIGALSIGESAIGDRGDPAGLRDRIALRALELIVGADPREFLLQMTAPDPAPATSLANVARLSYAIADAMLVARNG